MNASDLTGATWHLLRGSKYAGPWAIDSAELVEDGPWIRIRADKTEWVTRLEDCFATEVEARTEAKARRKPRQVRQPVALYGDWAQLARFPRPAHRWHREAGVSLFRRSAPVVCAVRSCEQAARVRVSHMELAESVCHAHVVRFEHAWGQVYVKGLGR